MKRSIVLFLTAATLMSSSLAGASTLGGSFELCERFLSIEIRTGSSKYKKSVTPESTQGDFVIVNELLNSAFLNDSTLTRRLQKSFYFHDDDYYSKIKGPAPQDALPEQDIPQSLVIEYSVFDEILASSAHVHYLDFSIRRDLEELRGLRPGTLAYDQKSEQMSKRVQVFADVVVESMVAVGSSKPETIGGSVYVAEFQRDYLPFLYGEEPSRWGGG